MAGRAMPCSRGGVPRRLHALQGKQNMTQAEAYEQFIHSVRLRLIDSLEKHGLDPDQVFITEVEDTLDLKVVTSRSLVLEAVAWVERGEEPTYDPGLFGVFSESHSFEQEHRVHSLRLSDFEKMIRLLLDAPPGA